MIRANLLPVSGEALSLFGASLERRLVRDAIAGLIVLCLVSATTYAIEQFRLSGLRHAAESLEQAVALNATRRRELAAMAADVARLEQLQREAETRRRSGNAVAATLIAIGNAVPMRVWLDDIDQSNTGFVVSGGASSLDDVGDALVAVERAMPGFAPSLANISREDSGPVLHFSVQLRDVLAPAAQAPISGRVRR
jgi:Tfp pilus assembly protein PilN